MATRSDDRPYHHGNLRRALLDAATEAITTNGPHSLSLRELAAAAGVSHGAPAHHFGDKTGLLTAVAAEGFALLADQLERARDEADSDRFLAVGLAYVAFAGEHPAHFQVMYAPDLYRADDAEVSAGRARAGAALYGSAGEHRPSGPSADVGLAGWCLMHGLATLWLSGNLAGRADSAVALARRLARTTFERSG